MLCEVVQILIFLHTMLLGVKCLPPLASKGFGLNEINCEELEIMRVDPLHDFRNLIQNILIELPSCAPKNGVGGRIKDFCSNINGKYCLLVGVVLIQLNSSFK